MAQESVLWMEGSNNHVSDCVVEWSNGCGARLAGKNNTITRLTSRFNGELGLGSIAENNVLEDSRFVGNNTKGFDKNWEAGGIKVVLSKGIQVRRCLAFSNDGHGFWFDIDNRAGVIEERYASDNHGPGVLVEISESTTIRNNLCVGNGLRNESGSWAFAGILLAESKYCWVENNTCVDNRCGIAVRQSGIRLLGPKETVDQKGGRPTYTEGHAIRKNIMAFNVDWQFAFFGDNPSLGKHPTWADPEFSAEELELVNRTGHRCYSDTNLYYSDRQEGPICWGGPWRAIATSYHDIKSFQKDENLEKRSVLADPQFEAWQHGQFGLRAKSPAWARGLGVDGNLIEKVQALGTEAKKERPTYQ